jgi:hypothetical protein
MTTILNTSNRFVKTATSKSGLSVEFFQFDESKESKTSVTPGTWVIQSLHGETIDGISNLQRLKNGDYVCRDPMFYNDIWVVNKSIFESIYTIT